MAVVQKSMCSDCEGLDRRNFMGSLARGAVVLGGLGPVAARAADGPAGSKSEKPAEGMIRELYGSLSDDQKRSLVYPWNHGGENGELPTRFKMVNAAHFGKRIGESYTKPQQELCERILQAICSDEEGYRKISRNGKFDGSGGFNGIGAVIFGQPTDGQQYSMVFSGHHLTVRCDGNSEPGAAFGGPMYYGHSAHGYSPSNVYFYQTKSVLGVFDALNEGQRTKAVITGKDKTPGEQYPSVKFRASSEARPGIAYADLTADQKQLIEQVMRDVLSPYRKEDADEVLDIVKANGGMDRMNLAFYQDSAMNDNERWHFWRIEGPGFVWNYRVLPHVHTFVNISSKV